ncbi:hypothetical protein PUN28_018150 [Cardiocondyla obscurior]|uniref:Uncharacterized protein n=1 Tax=Cardiocondyla obscurior TaxID=286306 RepID=A0AAW2EIU1_9HYME
MRQLCILDHGGSRCSCLRGRDTFTVSVSLAKFSRARASLKLASASRGVRSYFRENKRRTEPAVVFFFFFFDHQVPYNKSNMIQITPHLLMAPKRPLFIIRSLSLLPINFPFATYAGIICSNVRRNSIGSGTLEFLI